MGSVGGYEADRDIVEGLSVFEKVGGGGVIGDVFAYSGTLLVVE